MSAHDALDETIRSIVREVVREEVRAALDDHAARTHRRNGATSNSDEGYLSIARAAKFAGVAPGTLRRWIRAGRLTARRAGRVLRISRNEIEDFLAREGRAADVTDRARAIVSKAG